MASSDVAERLILSNRERQKGWVSIFRSILACATGGGTRATVLIHRVGLSTFEFREYVEALTRANLLEMLRHGRVVTYITTAKGRSFIETFDELAKSQTVRPRSIYFSARN